MQLWADHKRRLRCVGWRCKADPPRPLAHDHQPRYIQEYPFVHFAWTSAVRIGPPEHSVLLPFSAVHRRTFLVIIALGVAFPEALDVCPTTSSMNTAARGASPTTTYAFDLRGKFVLPLEMFSWRSSPLTTCWCFKFQTLSNAYF